jgi:hypothetical protein
LNLKTADDFAVYIAITRGFRRLHSYGIWYNVGKVEHHPVACPVCSQRVSFDMDYYHKHDGPFPISLFRIMGVPLLSTVSGVSP